MVNILHGYVSGDVDVVILLLGEENNYIFLLRAVMSLEALITRSRRSWCSSSSSRKMVNMGMKLLFEREAGWGWSW